MHTNFLPPSVILVKPRTRLKTMPERSLRLFLGDKTYDASRNSMPVYEQKCQYQIRSVIHASYTVANVLSEVRLEFRLPLLDVGQGELIHLLCNRAIFQMIQQLRLERYKESIDRFLLLWEP